jgi:hypothetical protein
VSIICILKLPLDLLLKSMISKRISTKSKCHLTLGAPPRNKDKWGSRPTH